MIGIEEEHDVIRQSLEKMFIAGEERPAALMTDFSDFDGVRIKMNALPDSNELTVSVFSPCWASLQSFNAEEHLDAVFGEYKTETAEDMSYSIKFDLNALPEDTAALVDSVSRIKTVMYNAPLLDSIKAVNAGSGFSDQFKKLDYRPKEAMYYRAQRDGVVVIFSVDCIDPMEAAIARVFCQEFDAARKQPNMSSCPPCQFTDMIPQDLEDTPDVDKVGVGFVAFKLDTHHFEGAKAAAIGARLQNWRTYLAFHIKGTKAFLHGRMRKRGATWLAEWNAKEK